MAKITVAAQRATSDAERNSIRDPINWAISLIAFALLVFVLQNILNPLIADAIAITIVFCVFFLVLDKRAISIECPHCGGCFGISMVFLR